MLGQVQALKATGPLAQERAQYQSLTGDLLAALAEPPLVIPTQRATPDDIRHEAAAILALATAANAIIVARTKRLNACIPGNHQIVFDANDRRWLTEPAQDFFERFEAAADSLEYAGDA